MLRFRLIDEETIQGKLAGELERREFESRITGGIAICEILLHGIPKRNTKKIEVCNTKRYELVVGPAIVNGVGGAEA
jgi:hypothetical protein